MHLLRVNACLLGTCLLGTAAVRKVTDIRWAPVQSFSSRLAPTVQVEGYSIQPPKSYRRAKVNGPNDSIVYAWIGATRRDGTRPMMMLNFISLPSSELKGQTLNDVSNKLLSGWKRHKLHWQQSLPQQGKLNGLAFVRVLWSGVQPELNLKTQGFSYVGRDGDRIIQILSQDVEPIPNQALEVAEASARTFKK